MHAKVEQVVSGAPFCHFIGGEFVGSSGGRMFDTLSPVTGEVYAQVHEAGREEVDAAVEAARAALAGPWGSMAVQQRVALLYELADGINARFDDFVEAECLDTGKPWSLARHVDIPRGAANFKIFADIIKNVPAESFMTDTPDGAGALNYALRVPKGVVGVICPWNLPLLLMTWKVGPALACGNAVVVETVRGNPGHRDPAGRSNELCGHPRGGIQRRAWFRPGFRRGVPDTAPGR